MTSRFIAPFFDVGSGIKPSSGAKLEFFKTGTSEPKDTFSDQLSTPTANTNPVIADSTGLFSNIFITGSYKVVLKDKNGSQIWSADPVDEIITGPDSFLYLEQVGGDPSGANDSTLALRSILDLGLQVRSRTNGTFKVELLDNDIYNSVDLQGPFTLTGLVSNGMFESNENFRADNITVTDTRYLMGNESSNTGQVLQIDRLHITNSIFRRCSWCLRVRTFNALAANKVGKNVVIEGNDVEDCGVGFAVNAFIFGYSIKDNHFKTIGTPLAIDSQVTAISIGQDNSNSDEILADTQGQGEIHGNTLLTMANTSVAGDAFTNFIQLFGNDTEIHGNTGKSLTGSGVDQEGIYIKGSRNKIHDNTLIDCGDDEGAIKQKGVNSGNGIKGTSNHFHHNQIEWSIQNDRNIGISSVSGSNYIHDNVIANARGQCIAVIGGTLAEIHNNTIRGLSANSAGSAEGILIQATPNANITGNDIEFNGQFDGDCFGVFIQSSGVAQEHINIEGGRITLVGEKAAATGSYRPVRVINLGDGLESLTIQGINMSIRGAIRGITGISNSITGTWTTGTIQNNINNMETTGTLTGIALGGPPTLLNYHNNSGFFDFSTYNAGQHASITNDANILNKFLGKRNNDTTNNQPIYAAGPLAGDIWRFADGTTAHTPV